MSNRKQVTTDLERSLKIEDEDHDRLHIRPAVDHHEDAVLLTVFSGEYIHAASHNVKLNRADARALRLFLTHYLSSKPKDGPAVEDEDEEPEGWDI